MKELGKRGIQATADKYFGGSIAECMSYLRRKGAELQIAALADNEGIRCVELPVLLDPDLDPFFDELSALARQVFINRIPRLLKPRLDVRNVHLHFIKVAPLSRLPGPRRSGTSTAGFRSSLRGGVRAARN